MRLATITVFLPEWRALQKLLTVPHEHDGMNECAICHTSLVRRATEEIKKLRKENASLKRRRKP